MRKRKNILGIKKRVILARFDFNSIVMEAIDENDEKSLDKQNEKDNINYFFNNLCLKNKDIVLYGEINLEDKKDIKYLEKYKNIICNPDAISNWIESNFDYEKGTITSNCEGIYKGYQTWQFLKWFKYNYCLIGKPKRILIYHYPTDIIRKNAPQWFTNS